MPTIYSHIDANKRKSVILIVFFFIFVIALGWLFGYLTESGYFGIIIAAIIAIFMTLLSYFAGDKVALTTAGAKPLQSKDDFPYVWRIVENIAITAGIPSPKIYVIDDPAPNAFATGRDPAHASIAITTGLINSLENEELEGVVAHELSHIKNYDIRIMMIVIVLVGTVALLADILIRIQFFGGGRRGRSEGNNQVAIFFILAGLLLAILSPLIAKLIQLAISRKREYLADADAALLTRYPEGLAKALEKIDLYKKPLKRANNATSHLYIANPFSGKKSLAAKLFSTHPPIADRVQALHKMSI